MVTNASRHRVTELWREGRTESEIAKRMGFSSDQVRAILRQQFEIRDRQAAYFRVRFVAEITAKVREGFEEIEREVRTGQ